MLIPAAPVDVSSLSVADLEQRCATTTLRAATSRAGFSRLSIPRFVALLDDIRDTGLTTTENGVVLRLLTTWAIACANQTARVLLLSASKSEVIRTYEDDVTRLCVRLRDAQSDTKRWFCGDGTLGAGVPAYGAPPGGADVPRDRVTLLRSLTIGGNRWKLHFAFASGLGPISARSKHPNGFAWPEAWNLNPNDRWPNGTSKAADYLAAIALKTTTASNGASISVYNRNTIDSDGRSGVPDPQWLNDCERDRALTFYEHPELASRGTFEGLFLHVVASEDVYASCAAWMRPLGIRSVPVRTRQTVEGHRCRYLPVGPKAALRMAVNTSDATPDRQKCTTK